MSEKRQFVWIVELYENGQWLPTTGASLTRADARDDLWRWRVDNSEMPPRHFRIQRYVSVRTK